MVILATASPCAKLTLAGTLKNPVLSVCDRFTVMASSVFTRLRGTVMELALLEME